MKILLADDSDFFRYIFKEYLISEGHKVIEFDNGKDAKIYLKKHKVDIIATDNLMPHLDGIELLKEFKDFKIPKLLITTEPTKELKSRAKKYGAKCVDKDLENLMKFIKKIK
ncbi:response regulator [Candidatus Margulisiibacteriota bacterium]